VTDVVFVAHPASVPAQTAAAAAAAPTTRRLWLLLQI